MDRNAMQALHGMLAPARTEALARELFWDQVTMYLESEARPALRGVYEDRVRPALIQALGRDPDRREVAQAMLGEDANRFWHSLRTQSQREALEASRVVIVEQLDELTDRARARSNGPGSLTLDPDLPMPSYLGADVHLQAGGYHAETRPDDLTAGALYDRQITLGRMGSQGWLNDDPGLSLAAWLKRRFPDQKPRRILEMGCTVGHTLVGFKTTFPEAEVHGIDVAAPGLRYGFARAASLGVDVHFHQQNAEQTRFPDGSFDVVYSRILMHETSAEAAPRIFAECHRLLGPGGVMFHSDAPQFDELDTYAASLRDWDTRFNNEPFMEGYYALPLEAMFEQAGFARGDIFRTFTPSLAVQRDAIDPKRSRTNGGRYFLAGAVKAG
jgi:ubiquinone/menaquinone biosynthesis C-methylase UbiE